MHMHAPHVAHTQKLRIDLDTCGSFASIRIVLEYTKFRTLFRTLNAKETLNLDYNLDRHTKFSRYATVLHENHARMHPSSMACVEIDPQLVCVTMDAKPFIVSE